MRAPRMLEPLRIRDFALLWTGMTVSLVGDAIFFVTMAWETYQLSNRPSALGFVSAAYTAPMVAFLLVGGVLTDRFERRHMMIVADVIRAAAIGTAGGLAIAGELRLWEFALLVAATGVGDALFAPAFGSIVPEIVPRELLAQANSLDRFVRPAAMLVGPAIAGIVITAAGTGVALVADAATFAVSTATALALTARPFEPRAGRSALRDLREGFGFVRAHAWLWGTLVTAAVMNIAGAARNVLLPFVLKNEIHGSARGLGLVYSAGAVGALVSSFVYGQRGLPRRQVLVMYAGWSLGLFAIGGYGVATDVPQLVVFALVTGVGFAYGEAIWGTMMHSLVPREVLGRVTSVDWMMSMSLMPICAAAAGFVAAGLGARATLVGAGLLSGAVAVLALLTIPGLRDPERESGPVDEAVGERAR
jgi:MFS family permease